jgi:[acyl-carrier-protein] S-malonyltransferase
VTAFLFPGQGVRVAEFAREWYESSPSCRRLLDFAAERTGLQVARVLHGSGEALRDTAVYQPVTVALCLGVCEELLGRGVAPAVVAGHSLGELSACAAAGAFSAESAVAVAAVRGRLMARGAERHPGGMVAIRVSSREAALQVARRVANYGAVGIAAHNGPDEFVLSGRTVALRALPEECRPTPLATSGPWHSAAMEDAVDEYRQELLRALRGHPRVRLVCNATGAVVGPDDDLAELLARQLTRPVEWVATMRTIARLGVSTVFTVGPAKALRRLARQALAGTASVLGVDEPRRLPLPVEGVGR